jgi:hypothetical protein
MTELKGRLVNLDIADGFTAVAPVLGSDPTGPLTHTQYPSSLVWPDKRKFEPRIGLAWRPLPTTPLVVRAGYGIYVDTSVYLSSVETMAQQSPLSTSVNVSNGPGCLLTLADGFHNCAGTTANTFAIDPNFRVGYAQVWRLSAQQDLRGSIVLTLSYLGTKGTRGPQEFLPNTYAPGSTAYCATCPRGFTYRTSNGNSIRHALDLQLRRRLRGGLTATLSYEYAKSIDGDGAARRQLLQRQARHAVEAMDSLFGADSGHGAAADSDLPAGGAGHRCDGYDPAKPDGCEYLRR